MQKPLRLVFYGIVFSATFAEASTFFTTSTFDSGREGWAGGASPTVIQGSDPFLRISAEVGSLATFNFGSGWSGDFAAAGIDAVTLNLRAPVTNTETLAIRATLLGPGTGTRWVSEPFSVPADGVWRTATFALEETALTRITGNASFVSTLADVNRVLFRHDPGAPSQQGDAVSGFLDLDNIRTVPEPGAGALLALPLGIALLRRRR